MKKALLMVLALTLASLLTAAAEECGQLFDQDIITTINGRAS